jgi:hypothetical protein
MYQPRGRECGYAGTAENDWQSRVARVYFVQNIHRLFANGGIQYEYTIDVFFSYRRLGFTPCSFIDDREIGQHIVPPDFGGSLGNIA